MKKNQYLFGLVLLLFLSACLVDNHKEVIVKDPSGFFTEKYSVINDSIKDGVYQMFYSNGKLIDSCFYKNDTLQGIRKMFSEKGYLEILETYKNGVLDGDYIVYYPNGNIKFKQTFINNVLSDYSYGYYDDGTLKEKVLFKNGDENGAFEEYYSSGSIHWRGQYLNGDNEQDTLYEYSESGELSKKLFCKKGVCFTVWVKGKGFVKHDSSIILSDMLLDIPLDY